MKKIFGIFAVASLGASLLGVKMVARQSPEEMMRRTVSQYQIEPNGIEASTGLALSDTTPESSQDYIRHMFGVLSKYAGLNDTTLRVWNAANNSAIAVLIETHRGKIVKGGQAPIIYLVPRNLADRSHQYQGVSAYYDSTDRSIHLPANAPPVMMSALFYHEYYHHLQHEEGGPKPGSLSEVLAHSVSQRILNESPCFRDITKRVLSRKKHRSYKSAIASVDVSDLRDYDQCVLGHKSAQFTKTNIMQSFLAVGFAYADEHKLGLDSKQEMYAWLSQVSGTPITK